MREKKFKDRILDIIAETDWDYEHEITGINEVQSWITDPVTDKAERELITGLVEIVAEEFLDYLSGNVSELPEDKVARQRIIDDFLATIRIVDSLKG